MANYSAKNNYVGERAEKYLEVRRKQKNWQEEQKIVKKIVKKYLSDGQSIVDVPFGTGRFAQYYLEKGMEVYAVDISKDMLAEAKKIVNDSSVKYIVGDAENLPFKDKQMDDLICARLANWVPMDVLENFIKEFERVSKQTIILEVHVKTRKGVLRRFFQSFMNNPIKMFNSALRTVKKKAAKKSKSKNKHSSTYKVHDEKQVLKLFNKYNLDIQEEFTVKEYISWILLPSKFYVLKKSS